MFKGPGTQKTNAICKYKLNVEISSKSTYILEWTRNSSYFMWGFVATRPSYYDTYVYHYVYICGVQPSADTSFSALMEYRR